MLARSAKISMDDGEKIYPLAPTPGGPVRHRQGRWTLDVELRRRRLGPLGIAEVSGRLDQRLHALEDELRRVLQLLHRKGPPWDYGGVLRPLGAAYGAVQEARRNYVVPLWQPGSRP